MISVCQRVTAEKDVKAMECEETQVFSICSDDDDNSSGVDQAF